MYWVRSTASFFSWRRRVSLSSTVMIFTSPRRPSLKPSGRFRTHTRILSFSVQGISFSDVSGLQSKVKITPCNKLNVHDLHAQEISEKNIWEATACRVLSFFREYAEDLTVYYFLTEEYKWLLPETRVRYSIIVTWNMSYSVYNGGLGIPQERGNITRWTDCWNVQLVFCPCRR